MSTVGRVSTGFAGAATAEAGLVEAARLVCRGFAVVVRLRGAWVLLLAAAAAVLAGARFGAVRGGGAVSASAGAAGLSAASPMVSPLCGSGFAPGSRSSTGSVVRGWSCSELTPLTYQHLHSFEPPAWTAAARTPPKVL
ncbi:hypothetical protein [Leifsonia xyli]|uniref:hypothetical protein n=1 Tax=Leifsonia xyli TaxID=1575 RepID=UPI003D6749BF